MKRPCGLRVLPIILLLTGALECQQLTLETDSGKHILSRPEIEALPRIKITAAEHSTTASFEGASLKSVLEKAGYNFGEAMKARLTSGLLVEGADGYRILIALPEIDPEFTDKQIVLAFLKDGKPLGTKEGPYRIVMPDEKRMARWVRQVTTLKIVEVQ